MDYITWFTDPTKFAMLVALLTLAIIWSTIWKGVALWKAAKNSSTAWFIVLLIINTLGILEILYIFVFSKCCKKDKQIKKPIRKTRKR